VSPSGLSFLSDALRVASQGTVRERSRPIAVVLLQRVVAGW
jgi:hypothetical protein